MLSDDKVKGLSPEQLNRVMLIDNLLTSKRIKEYKYQSGCLLEDGRYLILIDTKSSYTVDVDKTLKLLTNKLNRKKIDYVTIKHSQSCGFDYNFYAYITF